MAAPRPKDIAATVLYLIGVFALIYLTESKGPYTCWQVVWISTVMILLLVAAMALHAAGVRERKEAAVLQKQKSERS